MPSPSSDNISPSQPAFWENRYQESDTPWDLDAPAPPFVAWLHDGAGRDWPRGTLAVLGAGAGHDAALFAQAGFTVTGFDFAPSAVAKATERYGAVARFVQADIFDLPPESHGQFDAVVEHTCFCAIPPERRRDYVTAVQQLLKPGGCLIALFWMHAAEGGPPYRTDEAEILALFEPDFEILTLEAPTVGAPGRLGEERLAVLQKRPA